MFPFFKRNPTHLGHPSLPCGTHCSSSEEDKLHHPGHHHPWSAGRQKRTISGLANVGRRRTQPRQQARESLIDYNHFISPGNVHSWTPVSPSGPHTIQCRLKCCEKLSSSFGIWKMAEKTACNLSATYLQHLCCIQVFLCCKVAPFQASSSIYKIFNFPDSQHFPSAIFLA